MEGKLFYAAEQENQGTELWMLDSEGAARLVKDIAVGEASGKPRNLIPYAGTLYFQADDGIHGEELWRRDGTDAGTYLARDIVAVPQEPVEVSTIAPASDGLYLSAGLPATGTELWRLHAEEGKPMLLKDIATPRGSPVPAQRRSRSNRK